MESSDVSGNNRLVERLQPILMFLSRSGLIERLARSESTGVELVSNLVQRQQDAELRRELIKLHSVEVAHLLGMVRSKERKHIWDLLDEDVASEVLLELNEALAAKFIRKTEPQRAIRILDCLNADKLSELEPVLPPELLQQVFNNLDLSEQLWLREQRHYPDDSVGEIMQMDMLLVTGDFTVRQAIEKVQETVELPEQCDNLFVVDRMAHLLGAVSLISLLRYPDHTKITELMVPDLITFTPFEEAEEAVKAFERFDLVSAPVVDARRRILGRLTVEAVMDFSRERLDEISLAREGLSSETDLFGPIWEGARQRWLWLSINLVTAFLASRFIGVFEDTIEQLVALATLMPIVASVGGNTGNQTIALFIRGLALEQIGRQNLMFLISKELVITLANGVIWGSVLGLFAMLLYSNVALGLVMAAAMILNLLVAAVVGISVPLIMHRLGRDPAMGSSVVLTFMTDSMGFFIFLGLASLFLV